MCSSHVLASFGVIHFDSGRKQMADAGYVPKKAATQLEGASYEVQY